MVSFVLSFALIIAGYLAGYGVCERRRRAEAAVARRRRHETRQAVRMLREAAQRAVERNTLDLARLSREDAELWEQLLSSE